MLIGLQIQSPAAAVAQDSVTLIPLDSIALRNPVPANAGAAGMLLRGNQPLGVRSKLAGETSAAPLPNNTNSMYRSRTTYVVGGAVLGALAAGAALAVYFANASSDAVAHPLALVPIVIGGAAIGALLGALISR